MKSIPLRPLLWFDASTCVAMGLLLTITAGPLSAMLGLPSPILQEVGIFLLAFALFVAWVATRPDPRGRVPIVIAANVGWTIGSFALLAVTSPTAIGIAFVAVQALAVAMIAALQAAAARRTVVSA
jgi:hypothetical protein